MPRYYVNKNAQANGDHEVHATGCSFMPEPENRTYLGEFSNCFEAVREARKHYSQVNGCYYCLQTLPYTITNACDCAIPEVLKGKLEAFSQTTSYRRPAIGNLKLATRSL